MTTAADDKLFSADRRSAALIFADWIKVLDENGERCDHRSPPITRRRQVLVSVNQLTAQSGLVFVALRCSSFEKWLVGPVLSRLDSADKHFGKLV